MRIKTFLIMVLSLASLTAFAQGGGVKGKVVSRTTRAAIDGVKVTLTPGDITTTTDATGNFEIDKLAKGEYSLTFDRIRIADHCRPCRPNDERYQSRNHGTRKHNDVGRCRICRVRY